MERLVNVFESVFRRDIAQRRAGLDELPEVVGAGWLCALLPVLVAVGAV